MDSDNLKIKFYSLGSEKLDLSKISDNITFDLPNTLKPSKRFSEALNIVTKKDINALNRKVKKIIKEIIRVLTSNQININGEMKYEIKDIDNLIIKVEEIINCLLKGKEKNKVGIFSSNKKQKKSNLKKIDDSIEFLLKSKTELISMKNEYNKLISRSVFSEDILTDECIKNYDNEVEKEDPIERTINFYMNNLK